MFSKKKNKEMINTIEMLKDLISYYNSKNPDMEIFVLRVLILAGVVSAICAIFTENNKGNGNEVIKNLKDKFGMVLDERYQTYRKNISEMNSVEIN